MEGLIALAVLLVIVLIVLVNCIKSCHRHMQW